jgi:cytochrome bd-type quinol oxidase subunit 2
VAIAVAVVGLATAILARGWTAFLGSAAWLTAALGGIAVCLWPSLLVSTHGGDLTVFNAASPPGTLRVAVWWLAVGLPLVITWFVIVYRAERGKVKPHG